MLGSIVAQSDGTRSGENFSDGGRRLWRDDRNSFPFATTTRALNSGTGAVTGNYSTCADADDVYFDAKRHRIYVSCGVGAMDVFDRSAYRNTTYRPSPRLSSAPGPRFSCLNWTNYMSPSAPVFRFDAAVLYSTLRHEPCPKSSRGVVHTQPVSQQKVLWLRRGGIQT